MALKLGLHREHGQTVLKKTGRIVGEKQKIKLFHNESACNSRPKG